MTWPPFNFSIHFWFVENNSNFSWHIEKEDESQFLCVCVCCSCFQSLTSLFSFVVHCELFFSFCCSRLRSVCVWLLDSKFSFEFFLPVAFTIDRLDGWLEGSLCCCFASLFSEPERRTNDNDRSLSIESYKMKTWILIFSMMVMIIEFNWISPSSSSS